MKTITVSLPESLAEALEARVATGEFDSFDDALTDAAMDAIPYTGSNRITAETTVEELRAMIQVGIDQADRSQVVDGEEFMAELIRRTEERLAEKPVSSR